MKQKIFSTIFLTVFFSLVGVSAVYADTTSTLRSEEVNQSNIVEIVEIPENKVPNTTVSIRIEGPGDTILEKTDITFSGCSYEKDASTTIYYYDEPVVYCALKKADEQLGLNLVVSYGQYGMGIEGIDGIATDWINSPFWLYSIEDMSGYASSIDLQQVQDDDSLVFYTSDFTFPSLSIIEVSSTTFNYGATTTLQGYYWDTHTFTYQPVAEGTQLTIEGEIYTASVSGTVEGTFNSGEYTAQITDTSYIRSEKNSFVVNEAPQSATVRIELLTPDEKIVDTTLEVTECPELPDSTTTTLNAKCALEQAIDLNLDWSIYGESMFLNAVGKYVPDYAASLWWSFYYKPTTSTLEYAITAMNQQVLQSGDLITLTYGVQPLRIETVTTTVQTSATATIYVYEAFYDFETDKTIWIPSENILYGLNNGSRIADEDGIIEFTTSTPGVITVSFQKDEYILSGDWPLITFVTSTIDSSDDTDTQGNDSNGGSGGGCSSCGADSNSDVDTVVKNIITFLDANQNQDGSFSSSVSFSDWTALAYSAYTGSTTGKDKLKTYLLTNPNPIDGPNETTGYARRAMALMSYGINPYSGTDTNYIEKILDGFDGTQFGIEGLINDDVFALIPLLNAGYTASDPIVVSTTKYILEKQDTTGKFESPDITGATLQVLSKLTVIDGVNTAIEKGTAYILDQQKSDGGFGDIYGTSWIIQGLSAQNVDIKTLKKNNFSPIDYLKANQEADGGIGNTKNSLRLWTSAWAVPALLEKPWPTLLTSFSIPSDSETQSTGGSTTTEDTTTSTPEIAEQGTSTSTDALADETTSENTSEVTILPLPYDTQEAVGYGIGGGIDDQTIEQNVAGVKITNNTVPLEKPETQEDEKTEKRVEEPLFEEATATIQENSSGNGTKPIHYAFGTTILLGLLLGWRFLRTLV
ncbi:MAG: hypothetical protein COX82_04730 [Candidatus Magasanikbacteria bacterium CG_4_10_14_0_2_um_filter_41_10]|uniref:Squalene cyclase C-terminal domain-containing protein n=1 Tax=Candidatus Magasanikbacteria bacterium CG_4_10_14_0_2_um_filter_41_10 TaxID=1974638 RepID=A0A2M7V228_9BACT|nr:MAG: hypothetical protein COX82_04730 [Candidatus Magasanikbacteria bacterium CG_4_10_14_0_2_um_filter_41_10]